MASSKCCDLANVRVMSLVAALLMLPLVASSADDFYDYGIDHDDLSLAKGEDAAVMVALKGAPFRMYEKSFTQISVS